jgi:Leucine-rich repeat (LRR) protein
MRAQHPRGSMVRESCTYVNSPSLQRLDISSNHLSSFAFGDTDPDSLPFIRLKELNVSNNRISKIQGLFLLEELESLDASQNQIEEMRGLECCPCLRTLNLAQNRIRKLQHLAANPLLDVSFLN